MYHGCKGNIKNVITLIHSSKKTTAAVLVFSTLGARQMLVFFGLCIGSI